MDKQQNIEARPGDAERPQSPAERRPAGVAGCRGNGKLRRCCGCCAART